MSDERKYKSSDSTDQRKNDNNNNNDIDNNNRDESSVADKARAAGAYIADSVVAAKDKVVELFTPTKDNSNDDATNKEPEKNTDAQHELIGEKDLLRNQPKDGGEMRRGDGAGLDDRTKERGSGLRSDSDRPRHGDRLNEEKQQQHHQSGGKAKPDEASRLQDKNIGFDNASRLQDNSGLQGVGDTGPHKSSNVGGGSHPAHAGKHSQQTNELRFGQGQQPTAATGGFGSEQRNAIGGNKPNIGGSSQHDNKPNIGGSSPQDVKPPIHQAKPGMNDRAQRSGESRNVTTGSKQDKAEL